jgi:glycosyltransferase involved in cell wall biosynthesis
MMTRCVRPRAGAASPAAWTLIPYMRANLQTKRSVLAQASAVIAPSHAITDDLRRRAPELAQTPLYTIPNPVDMTRLDEVHRIAVRPSADPLRDLCGKLAPNKGVQFLIDAYADANVPWPLVIVGEGPLRAEIEAKAGDRGVAVRMLGWLPRDSHARWMRHAEVLAFPSYGLSH